MSLTVTNLQAARIRNVESILCGDNFLLCVLLLDICWALESVIPYAKHF